MKWLVLLLIIWHVDGLAPIQTSATERSWNVKRVACEKEICKDFNIDTNMNCVNKCLSEKCYTEIYEKMPLEDGEIDSVRSKQFISCSRKDSRDRQLAERSERAKQKRRGQ